MGLRDLQSHLTQNTPNTVDSVDLLIRAHGMRANEVETEKMKLAVDGECCLDRLYGGYFSDWVCGGQWSRMEQFLRDFATVLQGSNLDLIIFFNGSLELERLDSEWKKTQEETHRFVEEIHRHVSLKKKPPPKIWWVPPAYLRSAVRLALRSLQMRMMCTIEDHHKEVVRFCERNNFHGVVADDPEYLCFDIPRYFSAQKLKITFKGSLRTVEVKLKKVFESLNLPKEKFHIFAALLGNHILSEADLKDFYSTLEVSSETPVVERVAAFIKSQERLEPEKVAAAVCKPLMETQPEERKELLEKVTKCLRYYSDLTFPKPGNPNQKVDNKGNNRCAKKNEQKGQKSQASASSTAVEGGVAAAARPSDSQKLEGDSSKIFTENETPEQLTNGNSEVDNGEANVSKSSLDKMLYRVNPEIESVCMNRHKNGLISPYIYHILKHKEVKLPLIIQEAKDSKEIPRAHDLFRPLRQRVYAILFNFHHLQFLAKQRREKIPTLQVKETFYCQQTKSVKTDLVNAVELGWGVPTVDRLWLGENEDCKRKRTRAFLTIMKSDRPVVLDSNYVPQQMLVLTCVLRYIMSTGRKFLRKNELEAFIAQAFIQDMTDPSIAQDFEVANLTMRGVYLSHLFMEGVEMALLANDACGAPIPFTLFCPWIFFNGKVFNYVLEQQGLGKSLAEICGFKMDLVFNVEQLKLAIYEGVKVQYVRTPIPAPFLFPGNAPLMNQIIAPPSRVPYFPSHMAVQDPASLAQLAAAAAGNRNRLMGYPSSLHSNNAYSLTGAPGPSNVGGMYVNTCPGTMGGSVQGRQVGVPICNDIPGRQQQQSRVPPRSGGQLEVAGMVMGYWEPNYGGPSGNYPNPLTQAGRNVRIPMGPGAYVSQNMQEATQFDQMRISSGGKVPNARPPPAPWHQRKNNVERSQVEQHQKKSTVAKKGGEAQNSTVSGAGKTTTSNKSKGISFKEEPQNKKKIGAGASVLPNYVEKIKGQSVGPQEVNSSLSEGGPKREPSKSRGLNLKKPAAKKGQLLTKT